jgi:hypothetical protein
MRLRTVTYYYEHADNPAFPYARFTLRTINVGQLGEYGKLSRVYTEHFNNLVGGRWAKMSDEEKEEADPAAVAKSRIWQQWAYVRHTITKVETSENGKKWDPSTVEEIGYGDLASLDSMPLDLLDALYDSAQFVNSGVLQKPEDLDPPPNRSIKIE